MAAGDDTKKLFWMRAVLLRAAGLAGYAAAISERADELLLTAIALEQAHEEGDDLMSVAQVLKDNAAAIKQSAADVETAVQSAITRLSSDPTAADIQSALDDLNTAKTSLDATKTAADSIDPANTDAGGVVDNGSGGVVEPGAGDMGGGDTGTPAP